MSVRIDEVELSQRAHDRLRQEGDGVDAWVVWKPPDVVDRYLAAAAVREAAERVLESGTWTVRATTGGTFVWLAPAGSWRSNVDRLGDELARHGHHVAITVPPTIVWSAEQSRAPAPAALILLPQGPLDADGPLTRDGRPAARWGVATSVSSPFLKDATRWVAEPGGRLQIDGVVAIPATVADAPELLEELAANLVVRPYVVALDAAGQYLRALILDDWGTTAWCDTLRGRDPVEVAAELRRLLVGYASLNTYGAVGLAVPGLLNTDPLVTRAWQVSPQLRDTYVPRVHPIQLLNRRQLDRAHDLSAWDVEAVGEDRWLVSARDLRPWVELDDPVPLWTGDFPARDVREQAAADFGELVLTRPVARAHREASTA